MALAAVSTPDIAKDLFSGLWDQTTDKELYQAYTNLDNFSSSVPSLSSYSSSSSYIQQSACSVASPTFCASPVSTGSTCSENSGTMNTHPYYPGTMASSSPLNNRYTQLALLLVSQSQNQNLSREEEEKRRVRRERNKVAATKCREKRKAHSVYVRHEYSQVIDTTKRLEEQINTLKRERDELMRLLDTHECCNPDLGRSGGPMHHHQLLPQNQLMSTPDMFIKSEPPYHH